MLLVSCVMFRRRSSTRKEAWPGTGGGAAGAQSASQSLLESPHCRTADAGVFDTGAAVVENPPLYLDTYELVVEAPPLCEAYVPPGLPDSEAAAAEDELAAQEQAAMIRRLAQEQREAAEAIVAPSMSAMAAGRMQLDQQARGKAQAEQDVEEHLPFTSAASHVPSELESASALSVGPAQAERLRDLDEFSSTGLESTAARVAALVDASESTDKPADAMPGAGNLPSTEGTGRVFDSWPDPPEVTEAPQAVQAAGFEATQPVAGLEEELRELLVGRSQDAVEAEPFTAAPPTDISGPIAGLEEFTGSMADRLQAAASRHENEANLRDAERKGKDQAPASGQDSAAAPAPAPASRGTVTRPPQGEILEEITEEREAHAGREARQELDEVPAAAATTPALVDELSGTQEGFAETQKKTSWFARIFGKRQVSSSPAKASTSSPMQEKLASPAVQAEHADAATTSLSLDTHTFMRVPVDEKTTPQSTSSRDSYEAAADATAWETKLEFGEEDAQYMQQDKKQVGRR